MNEKEREIEKQREVERLRVKKEEKKRVKEQEKRVKEQEKRVKEEEKKQELKAMITQIQEEVQAKVNGQVVAMLQTFIGDVSVLLRHLLKGGETGEANHETVRETVRALQVLQQYNLGESDTDSNPESDSEQSDRSEGGNTNARERNQGRNTPNSNTCQCGKAVRQYQGGR